MRDVESVFKEYEIDYERKMVPIDNISSVVSIHQIRHDELNLDLVDDYTDAIKRGDQFPPVVLAKMKKKFERIDGNHRIAAAQKAGLEEIDAYVVSAPEPVLAVLKIELNNAHGLRMTRDEQLAYAEWLVDNYRLTVDEAVAKAGVSSSAFSTYRTKRQAKIKLEAAGVRPSVISSLPQYLHESIAAVPGERVVKQLAELANDASLNQEQVRAVGRELKGLTTERARIKHLEEIRDERYKELIQIRKVSPRRTTARDSAAAKLSRGIGLILSTTSRDVRLSVVDKDTLINRCRQAREHLNEVESGLAD
jgi:ParB-like chromosome segregation protein Spo0J